MSSPFGLTTICRFTSVIRFGNLLVPSAFYIFAGTQKAIIMTNKNASKTSKRGDAGDTFTEEDLPEKIGKNLRQIYDDVLKEPVPDDFLSLLSQADTKSK